ncbi:MAG: triphosphoribosyl-dephospho-CoA synthase, partial [Campylobacteraceae bacterium]|nr:triphosphoribosyl-dephospho-CoA synthase [Campylobacteraceae bacterium]
PNKLDKNLKKLNKKFIKKNLNPGGSADMLALAYFFKKINIKI